MIDKNMLGEFKKLTPYVKDNLYYFLAFRSCYDYDSNISDDLVLRVANLAYNCWIEDNNNVDIDNYANYILNAIYEFGGNIEQIEAKDPDEIIELYTNEESAENLLLFNIEGLEYAFTTTNNEKYYLSDDGFFVLNQNGYKIRDPHPMEYELETFFDLFKENKIAHISFGMHYNVRCMMKEQFSDEEYELYKDGISNYKEYCEKKHITSRVILESVGLEEDIDLFDIDKEYTNANKLAKLKNSFQKNKLNGFENYVYVSSLTNGTDYYFDDKNNNYYVAIDKNGILKKLDNKPYFILNELRNKEDDLIYISKSELKRIKENLREDYEKSILRAFRKYKDNYNMSSLKKFSNYIKNKESDILKNDRGIELYVESKICQYEKSNEAIKVSKEQEKLKKKEKEI